MLTNKHEKVIVFNTETKKEKNLEINMEENLEKLRMLTELRDKKSVQEVMETSNKPPHLLGYINYDRILYYRQITRKLK